MVAKFLPVSTDRRCPVCDGDHKCSTTPDGLICCGRTTGPVPGFDYLGPAKNPTWHLFRAVGDLRAEVRQDSGDGTRPLTRHGTQLSSPLLATAANTWAQNFTSARANELATKIGLPAQVFARMPLLGFDPATQAFTFPEFDALGRIIGVLRRFPDHSKKAVPGSHRGLSIVGGWADEPGPVFVVEGPTDTLALAQCRLAVIGRFSNCGGADELAAVFGQLEPGRMVVVVGENDQKADGLWPGRDGARTVTMALVQKLKRPIHMTLPPAEYKDVRAWVVDRFRGAAEAFDWSQLGQDIARSLVANAVEVRPQATPRAEPTAVCQGVVLATKKYPMPVPLEQLELPGPGGVAWVWDGFLARDAVTLISALPKCGKTTLLSHLLAALPRGGEFCGRSLTPGRAVVVSEEPAGVWALRRSECDIPPGGVEVIPRGHMARTADLADWTGFLAFLKQYMDANPCDVLIFDTIANLWPVRDENSSAEVTAAMAPLHQLCPARSVVLVHHLRKSDGAEGTGSRGSGAIVGFVDIIMELRRMKATSDPSQRKRVLSGYGRFPGIPDEWVVELTDSMDPAKTRLTQRFVHRPEKASAAKGNQREAELRQAITAVLTEAGETGLTRKQIWDALPDEVRRNRVKFEESLEEGVGGGWTKEDRPRRNGGPLYRLEGI